MFCVSGISNISEIPDLCMGMPSIDTPENQALHALFDLLNLDKPFAAAVQIIRYVKTRYIYIFVLNNFWIVVYHLFRQRY